MTVAIRIVFIYLCFNGLCQAQQANYKYVNFGNRSILLSGNVTGSVDDLGVTYYNPGRLTEVENTKFAINAKAYQLSTVKLEGVVIDESTLSSTDFDGIPTMAGGTFSMFGERFAYSFLSRSRIDINLRYNTDEIPAKIQEVFPDAEKYKTQVRLNSKVKDEWIGLTWATKLSERFSFGISAFGSIYEYRGGSDLNYTLQTIDNSVAYYENVIEFRQSSYGLILKLGANYKLPKWDLGINVNLPYLELYQKGRYNYSEVLAGIDADTDNFYDYNFDALESDRKEPFGVSVGAGIPINRSKLHLNLDYVSSIKKYSRIDIPAIDIGGAAPTPVLFDEERKNIINFGVGANIFLTERFQSYLSFSTDFNGYVSNASILDLSSEGAKDINTGEDYYHMSFGFDRKFSWASFFIGTTYSRGATDFLKPKNLTSVDASDTTDEYGKITLSRWQFVVGLEIPFIDNKVDNLKEN
ncbi:hypothetical protein [Robiginitalea sp. SC105]|uniref:hypothetical protein n=1 Tax=Robiginitalea sp. SC105 TaxID=2762332 RepID=UPI00163AE106|nr:hypothetical protein [Robiginitalea sp. SC105]MBC2838856.1 hypothetical protein [Robiginitalea sp. SC105]